MAGQFNKEYKYTNIGTVVGTLCYFKPLERKDGSQYGGEFLINVQGHGSVNVRVPNMAKVEEILNEFPVENRPHVRVSMTQVDMFFAQTGKVYTNFTSFAPFKAVDETVADTAKGNISGEVIKMKENGDGTMALLLAVYNVDKDNNLIKNYQGQPLPAKKIKIDIVEPQLVTQVKKEVQEGTNLIVGYSFVNKNDVRYDEYGLPVGSGERVTRVEAGKLIVNANGKKEEPVVENDPFGADPFGNNDPFAFDLGDEDVPF